MELEKPQPQHVVTNLETDPKSETPIAALDDEEPARKPSASAQNEWNNRPVTASTKTDEDLPPGTIQAGYRPGPLIVKTRKPREKPFIPETDGSCQSPVASKTVTVQ